MSSLPSIPKRAIISIQPDPMGPFEFMNVNDAKEMLNSRHVGGLNVEVIARLFAEINVTVISVAVVALL